MQVGSVLCVGRTDEGTILSISRRYVRLHGAGTYGEGGHRPSRNLLGRCQEPGHAALLQICKRSFSTMFSSDRRTPFVHLLKSRVDSKQHHCEEAQDAAR